VDAEGNEGCELVNFFDNKACQGETFQNENRPSLTMDYLKITVVFLRKAASQVYGTLLAPNQCG